MVRTAGTPTRGDPSRSSGRPRRSLASAASGDRQGRQIPFEADELQLREHSDQPPRQPRWATTRPQSYVVYLVCLILVWSLSFFAGTLKPKKAEGLGPPPVMSPPR